jgi:acyl-CoA thioesterase-1|tara:strand:+ start:8079 stop:8687 length:609 start_codon:yes stop_codon:yes gene_type:complete
MKKLFFCFIVFLNPIIGVAKTSNILIFGDSLSAGYGIDIDQAWPTLLQQKLTSKSLDYHIINASISGETTEGGVARIENILKKYTPELIILELGGNDGLRGFPHQRIKNNLDKIIKTSIVKNASILLLGIKIPSNYGPRYTRDFEKIYLDLAQENNIPLIEFFMENVALDKKLMQDDGIHPNETAQPILLKNIWDTLLPLVQ